MMRVPFAALKYLHHEIRCGCVGIGFSAVTNADRVGQESIDIICRYTHAFLHAQLL